MMYHLLPDPVCFLFLFTLPEIKTGKAENVNSHVSPLHVLTA